MGRAWWDLVVCPQLLGTSAIEGGDAARPHRHPVGGGPGREASRRGLLPPLRAVHPWTGAALPRRKTLQLSRQLRDAAVEAQACYSLGNTYTLLQDHERAAEYHLRHLLIAQELADRCARSGVGRAGGHCPHPLPPPRGPLAVPAERVTIW